MSLTSSKLTRRDFVKSSSAIGAITVLPSYIALGNQSSSGLAPSEKVNLAVVGTGNRGASNWKAAMNSGHCNVVALCDIDPEAAHTQLALMSFGHIPATPDSRGNMPTVYDQPKPRRFTDFRKMFDQMENEIDAVLISTPDHSHFAVTMLAMSLGKHVYVEKPLAHTFGQCERLIRMAEKHPHLATQMGNQGHSGANYFQFKAWTEAGIIKDVTRITAHMNRPRRWHGWGQDVTAYPTDPAPSGIDWEQWIDAAAKEAPFSQRLHPGEWRSWYDYGCGCFGDWGPHILDTAHRFLNLGLPEKIVALKRDGVNDFVYPQATTILFAFPERDQMPACEVTWYDGVENMPELEAEYSDPAEGETVAKPTPLNRPGKVIYGKDLVFKGGSHAEALQIVPKQKFMDMRRDLPRFPQKNSNHYANFLLACKGQEETRSPFSVSGPLSQVFNLGILAQRFGGELQFDRESKKITNHALAQELMDPAPRKGWEEYYDLWV